MKLTEKQEMKTKVQKLIDELMNFDFTVRYDDDYNDYLCSATESFDACIEDLESYLQDEE